MATGELMGNGTFAKVIISLENCILPEETLNSTPSNADGLDAEMETDARILGCELMQTAGSLLQLPQIALATAQMLFHRFYYRKSMVRHRVETTAMGCILLASKIEEVTRRTRDIINVFNHIKQVNNEKLIEPVILDQNYVALKNQVLKAEAHILKELGFGVYGKHPHKIVIVYLQFIGLHENIALAQKSWNYMNDSLRLDLFMRHRPETVACACIYLAARQLKIPLPSNPAWFTLFEVEERAIRDVCRRVLSMYTRQKLHAQELDRKLDELKKKMDDARAERRLGNNSSSSTPSPPQPKTLSKDWGGFITRTDAKTVSEPTKITRKRSRSISKSRSKGTGSMERKKRDQNSGARTPHQSPSRYTPPIKENVGRKRYSNRRSRSRSRSRSSSKRTRRAEVKKYARRTRSRSPSRYRKADTYRSHYSSNEKCRIRRYRSRSRSNRERGRYGDNDRSQKQRDNKTRH